MTKFIKLDDLINLIDSKIVRIDEFLNNNNPSPYLKDKTLTTRSTLQQLKFEILKDNISEEFKNA